MCTKHASSKVAFITFIGTPYLKGSETVSRFSKIIHSNTMQQAASDSKAPRDCIDYVEGSKNHFFELLFPDFRAMMF